MPLWRPFEPAGVTLQESHLLLYLTDNAMLISMLSVLYVIYFYGVHGLESLWSSPVLAHLGISSSSPSFCFRDGGIHIPRLIFSTFYQSVRFSSFSLVSNPPFLHSSTFVIICFIRRISTPLRLVYIFPKPLCSFILVFNHLASFPLPTIPLSLIFVLTLFASFSLTFLFVSFIPVSIPIHFIFYL